MAAKQKGRDEFGREQSPEQDGIRLLPFELHTDIQYVCTEWAISAEEAIKQLRNRVVWTRYRHIRAELFWPGN
jgi:hypothetical protein